MYEILIVFIICLIFIIISILPILKLKYHNDLALYIDSISMQCNLYYDKIPEKNKYLFNIVSAIFDDYKYENWYYKNDKTYFKYYNWYAINGGAVLFMYIMFYIIFIGIFYNNFHHDYVGYNVFNTVSLYLIFYIIIYSLTLKKLNDLYKDTCVIDYHNNLFLIKATLKNKDTTNDKLKLMYEDNDDIGYLIYDTNLITKYITGVDTILYNSNFKYSFEISYDIDDIKKRLNDVFILLIPHIYLILILIIFIFKILHEMFDTIMIQIVLLILYICMIFFYVISTNLE